MGQTNLFEALWGQTNLLVISCKDTAALVQSIHGLSKGDIAIHGGYLENLGSHRFLAVEPVPMNGLPCLDRPERRPVDTGIT